jgi:hypothetical protein
MSHYSPANAGSAAVNATAAVAAEAISLVVSFMSFLPVGFVSAYEKR